MHLSRAHRCTRNAQSPGDSESDQVDGDPGVAAAAERRGSAHHQLHRRVQVDRLARVDALQHRALRHRTHLPGEQCRFTESVNIALSVTERCVRQQGSSLNNRSVPLWKI